MQTILQKTIPEFHSVYFDVNKITGMERVEKDILDLLSDSKGDLREMCLHILHAGGKRIRPLLVIYSGLVFSDQMEELRSVGTAAELIHMASLVHDDVIDNSSLRRKKLSINKKWGNHFAVLCGDYLFAKAFGVLSKVKTASSMEYMVEAIQQMCQGEVTQANERFNLGIDLNQYYEIISKKTASFLECCCKAGAAIGGASQRETEILGEYGKNLGLAFQIVDDVLDFCGDVSVMGKPKGEDIRQGNITLPLLLLLTEPVYHEKVRDRISDCKFTAETVTELSTYIRESGALNESLCIATTHIEKARNCLTRIPQSQYTSFLADLTVMLQARMN